MFKTLRLNITVILLISCLTIISHSMVSASTNLNMQPQVSFEENISNWIKTLKKQDGFGEWEYATWKSYALGPGTHNKLVILSNQNTKKEIGYLVIGADSEGHYKLVEYGVGEYPLFSLNTLQTTFDVTYLKDLQIPEVKDTQLEQYAERLYPNALEAIWKVNIEPYTFYIDAKSGEIYPIDSESINESPREINYNLYAGATSYIQQSLEKEIFDPFEKLPWVFNEPQLISNDEEFQIAVHNQEEITYTEKLFQKEVRIPLAVVGYHRWDEGQLYIALEQNGVRYIHFMSLYPYGQFF
ncbi:hypothetical protein [Chengkuizengella axinellae]|uniref:CAP-associated domain-containing protein n=1 Tax=Chengkuizengella axinellae TaxID=3064388 RepID=A0ABT9IYY6_9BACL|nr:hypothetical protein [Chengkuizengella sp. 2205SS18-9]MDP5274584.1 hypothetical protein [Chengkuizengella sp. 2205SS18-9]